MELLTAYLYMTPARHLTFLEAIEFIKDGWIASSPTGRFQIMLIHDRLYFIDNERNPRATTLRVSSSVTRRVAKVATTIISPHDFYRTTYTLENAREQPNSQSAYVRTEIKASDKALEKEGEG